MANTRIWYGYKPYDGTPVNRSFVLAGEMSKDDTLAIRRMLSMGNQFIPDQVGLPSLNDRDPEPHAWHSFDVSAIAMTAQKPDVSMSVQDLVERFTSVVWNPSAETVRLYGSKGAPNARIARAAHH